KLSWATPESRRWSFVRYDAHPAGWSIAVPCGVDLPARRAALQPPNLLTALSQGDPGGRPAEIGQGEADLSPAWPAHRSALCIGIVLASRDSRKPLLLGPLRLCLRSAFPLQPR